MNGPPHFYTLPLSEWRMTAPTLTVLGRSAISTQGNRHARHHFKVQTLYPHLFDPGTALYSQPGLVIGVVVDEDE